MPVRNPTRRRQLGSAAFAIFLATLFYGLSLSQEGGHQTVTYLVFYGLAAVSFVVVVLVAVLELANGSGPPEPQGGSQAVSGRGDAQAAGRDALMAGRDIHITHEPRPTGNVLARALADAETELQTIRLRVADVQEAGFYPLGFILPAFNREAVAHGLADEGLDTARRQVDAAYIECDRLNNRLEGRFWSGGPSPEPAPAELDDGDRLEFVLHRVDTAIGAIRSIRTGAAAPAALQLAGPWWKREEITGQWSDAEWAEFVGLYVVNDGPDIARSLWAELEFSAPDGAPLPETELTKIMGRWSQAPVPEIGDSPEERRFTQIDLDPNGRPEPLDVAVRFESDAQMLAMNSRNLLAGGRHGIFLIPLDSFEVQVRIRGVGGIGVMSRWSCSRDNFRLTERARA